MKHMPLVSVIIPVYNCEHYLSEAIESVLAQTYQPIEIIVVDDGSTDGSAEVVKRFSSWVQYIFQARSGAGSARNYGIALAQGSYLAFLDADDLWAEDKLEQQMAAFEADQALDMTFGHVIHFISPELDEGAKNKIYCPPEKMPGYYASAMLIKQEAFRRAGLFAINWKMGEFIDWYSKALDSGLKGIMLSEVLVKRRLHTANQSARERTSQSDYLHILKASLDRRQKKGG